MYESSKSHYLISFCRTSLQGYQWTHGAGQEILELSTLGERYFSRGKMSCMTLAGVVSLIRSFPEIRDTDRTFAYANALFQHYSVFSALIFKRKPWHDGWTRGDGIVNGKAST
ncbi:uncharacterized protein MYCFIDRAFT_174978 [Pseudocercospora fijiensis CIRAD86]|uniref:Uncharacterized protein n=1 Tax=Pseudocercospora fijiensis (strain CIRAD86) TaxID=383855 RepID=M3B2F5_PSEFD|nr:uncharacterized protein MYCFIDRAFT_174978 [Pseudocercospora fijiensis CIRAD86]EME83553.1 hypothetical protein MYCFIDRAFT_174978 [Pseudocercospora fijiensis CIRAD86]